MERFFYPNAAIPIDASSLWKRQHFMIKRIWQSRVAEAQCAACSRGHSQFLSRKVNMPEIVNSFAFSILCTVFTQQC
jgi:hypothetical protein